MIKLKSLLNEFWRDISGKYNKYFPGMQSGQYEEERSWINFKIISNKKATQKDALQFQTDFGKHPAGYGFYDFKELKKDNYYIYTWKCSRSSD